MLQFARTARWPSNRSMRSNASSRASPVRRRRIATATSSTPPAGAVFHVADAVPLAAQSEPAYGHVIAADVGAAGIRIRTPVL